MSTTNWTPRSKSSTNWTIRSKSSTDWDNPDEENVLAQGSPMGLLLALTYYKNYTSTSISSNWRNPNISAGILLLQSGDDALYQNNKYLALQ